MSKRVKRVAYRCQNPECNREFAIDEDDPVNKPDPDPRFHRKGDDELSCSSAEAVFCPTCGDIAEPV
jgi:hypothetical protein